MPETDPNSARRPGVKSHLESLPIMTSSAFPSRFIATREPKPTPTTSTPPTILNALRRARAAIIQGLPCICQRELGGRTSQQLRAEPILELLNFSAHPDGGIRSLRDALAKLPALMASTTIETSFRSNTGLPSFPDECRSIMLTTRSMRHILSWRERRPCTGSLAWCFRRILGNDGSCHDPPSRLLFGCWRHASRQYRLSCCGARAPARHRNQRRFAHRATAWFAFRL